MPRALHVQMSLALGRGQGAAQECIVVHVLVVSQVAHVCGFCAAWRIPLASCLTSLL